MDYQDFTDTFLMRLNRDDCTSAMAQYFITMGQAFLNSVLRIPAMEAILYSYPVTQTITNPVTQDVLTLTAVTQIALPDDFIAWNYLMADGRVLELATPHTLMGNWGFYLGTPQKYARIGANVYIRPFAQYNITAVYYQQFTPLVNPTDSNFLTTSAIECLMYASLVKAADHFRMDELPIWQQALDQQISVVNQLGIDADSSGGPMAVSMPYTF